jgi:Winged helix DNA-binding domain
MSREDILSLRLFNQGLAGGGFVEVADVVAHFGAMQAQDYGMALWAVGLRTHTAIRSQIEALVNTGTIIRTHILRPTWHFVHQKDIRWMMELSAPNVKKATQYIDKKEGLTNEVFLKTWTILEQEYIEHSELTKEEIMSCLLNSGMEVSNLLATQIIIRAELEMLLCNGTKKGSYALFEKRVPPSPKISKSEAIVNLAQLYFQSRGPATAKDFAWWSGLSMSEANLGIANLAGKLQATTYENLKYYFFETDITIPNHKISALLPCYDEYTVGYSEGRNLALPKGVDSSETGNGIFKPIVVSENEIVGTWRKTKKDPFVEMQGFSNSPNLQLNHLEVCKKRFEVFGAI